MKRFLSLISIIYRGSKAMLLDTQPTQAFLAQFRHISGPVRYVQHPSNKPLVKAFCCACSCMVLVVILVVAIIIA